MTARSAVVITGANGEIGHALIERLSDAGQHAVIAVDLREPDAQIAKRCAATVLGDVTDPATFARISTTEWQVHTVYHLAALLSTASEKNPDRAQSVNVDGTLRALGFAMEASRSLGKKVSFLFPSSIAVYGLPSLEAKQRAGTVSEAQHTTPSTMYGVNKLYCEQLGRYFQHHYRQLSVEPNPPGVDFRAIRFPGIISAFTVPSGGTSDYLPEFLHHAAQSKPYQCFVRGDSRIPFMAMPDAIDALLSLAHAPASSLSTQVYNVRAFNPTPDEFAPMVLRHFASASLSFEIHAKRQAIIDSWPSDIDDSLARRDWGFAPKYNLERMVNEYLVPNVRKRYATG